VIVNGLYLGEALRNRMRRILIKCAQLRLRKGAGGEREIRKDAKAQRKKLPRAAPNFFSRRRGGE
jgi:hypothetical protein